MKAHLPAMLLLLMSALVMTLAAGQSDGWSPPPKILTVHEDSDGLVYFRIFDASESHGGRLVPIGDNMFGVYRKGNLKDPFWWIVGKESRNVVQSVTYGVVPETFRQHIPALGAPPKLEPGRDYCAAGHSRILCFTYRGPSPRHGEER